ncbi:hypothetical protein CONPUDRAFT_140647 [Coniophora puteana RWD-64-598 SS2]|uniref:Uncharacterized protein n=1 Tax=Coniophora puteana (strain RWD-64-598) TaxID=741705 RepID=R7SG33_CONPW|nr:uncharacterized protein CONPUDRAFT_140647 [Coniophora puteana RWD-64-598 SS2]EIW74049.1 hypothetical protein CONPUDRAFT_140647 [Coniophora puteana RWD-64-598 SS2]
MPSSTRTSGPAYPPAAHTTQRLALGSEDIVASQPGSTQSMSLSSQQGAAPKQRVDGADEPLRLRGGCIPCPGGGMCFIIPCPCC